MEGEGYREVFHSCNAVVHRKRKDSITHKGFIENTCTVSHPDQIQESMSHTLLLHWLHIFTLFCWFFFNSWAFQHLHSPELCPGRSPLLWALVPYVLQCRFLGLKAIYTLMTFRFIFPARTSPPKLQTQLFNCLLHVSTCMSVKHVKYNTAPDSHLQAFSLQPSPSQ